MNARCIFSLLFIVIASAGCLSPNTPNPHPLDSWKYRPFDEYAMSWERHGYKLDQAIIDDYEQFVLPLRKPHWLLWDERLRGFYEDGKGNHAVKFRMWHSGTFQEQFWEYILFYDESNRRTNATKYLIEAYVPFSF